MASKTFNRGRLLKLAKAGKLISTQSYSYQDGYGEDRSTHTLPVHVRGTDGVDFKDGAFNVMEWDFKTNSGYASQAENGDIHLGVHSNCHYTLRIVG